MAVVDAFSTSPSYSWSSCWRLFREASQKLMKAMSSSAYSPGRQSLSGVRMTAPASLQVAQMTRPSIRSMSRLSRSKETQAIP